MSSRYHLVIQEGCCSFILLISIQQFISIIIITKLIATTEYCCLRYSLFFQIVKLFAALLIIITVFLLHEMFLSECLQARVFLF